jgi:hypothetical protein
MTELINILSDPCSTLIQSPLLIIANGGQQTNWQIRRLIQVSALPIVILFGHGYYANQNWLIRLWLGFLMVSAYQIFGFTFVRWLANRKTQSLQRIDLKYYLDVNHNWFQILIFLSLYHFATNRMVSFRYVLFPMILRTTMGLLHCYFKLIQLCTQ